MALAVLISHCVFLSTGLSSAEPLYKWTGYTLGQHGVQVFFFLSGILVAQSLYTSQSVKDYAIARGLRIFPALIVCVLLTAVVLGPWLSSLSAMDYLRDGGVAGQFFSFWTTPYPQRGCARSVAKQKEDEARLAKTEMRAAFPGVAGLRQVSEGQYVAAGTDIARIEKVDQLKLDFRIPESFVSRLKTGQPVKVVVDSYPGEAFAGSVFAIEPAVDEQTRTVLLRARVANAGLKLRPGMFARVQVQLGVREKAVWVPEAAIVPKGQDSFVFQVVDGKVALMKVQTGARKVGEVEIRKGLSAGDMVVTEGIQKIGPGSSVVLMKDEAKK